MCDGDRGERAPKTPTVAAYRWRSCQTTFSLIPSAWTLFPRFSRRRTEPSDKSAAAVQASIALLTQVGTGIVRTRPINWKYRKLSQVPIRLPTCPNAGWRIALSEPTRACDSFAVCPGGSASIGSGDIGGSRSPPYARRRCGGGPPWT